MRIKVPNGDLYCGQTNTKGKYHGYGVIYRDDGEIYEGLFSNGHMNGNGRLIDIEGNVYEGEFLNE